MFSPVTEVTQFLVLGRQRIQCDAGHDEPRVGCESSGLVVSNTDRQRRV
jgi:hypothetical protein